MTIAAFPEASYKCIIPDGYQESPPDNVLRTTMEQGPAKLRRKATSTPRPISFEMICTLNELETFETFFVDTLMDGTLRFSMDVLRSASGEAEFRFAKPPSYSPNEEVFSIACDLEQLP